MKMITYNTIGGYLFQRLAGERYYADQPRTDEERAAYREYRQKHAAGWK